MSVSSAVVATPESVPSATIVRASSRARSMSLHERAGAELHVEHERVGALGDLLRHDARGDQRDRLDRAGDVAQRVELLVGRSEARAGGADDRADVAQLREHLVVATAPRASRGSTRACRACRRCGRGRGRDSCGTATPNAATSGASGRVILSPTPPVECLSTVGLPSPAKLIRSPDAIIASVMTRISSRSMPLQQHRHRERRHLRVGDVAARVGVDHPAQRVLGHGPAVALGADDVDGVEGLDAAATHRSDRPLRARAARTRRAAPRRSCGCRRRSRAASRASRVRTAAAGSGRTA